MASVAIHQNGGPVPLSQWSKKMLREAKRAAYKSIAKVGDDATDTIEHGTVAFIIRRRCTDRERRFVPEKYLKCSVSQ